MKTERNILVAFILNLAFSVFELFGGIFTGSVAILSDAVHDLGDAVGIGTHEELLTNCEVYREIYESQFKKEDTRA